MSSLAVPLAARTREVAAASASSFSAREILLGFDYTFTARIMKAIALVAMVGHPLFYVFDGILFGMKDSLPVRLGVALLCIPPALLLRGGPLQTWHKVYWELLIAVMLPISFAYLFVLNDLNTYWYASMIFAGLGYGLCSRLVLVAPLFPLLVGVTTWLSVGERELARGELQRILEAYLAGYFTAIIMSIVAAILESALQRATRAEAHLRQVQARLLEHEKLCALGRVLAQLSHEISNPMNVIANNLGPLSEYFDSTAEVLTAYRRHDAALGDAGRTLVALCREREIDFVLDETPQALRVMEEAARRVHSVQADLRTFVGGQAARMQRGELGAQIEGTLEMIRRGLPEGVTLTAALGRLPPLEFHGGQLGQVLFNLVQNAIDAMGGKGEVRVRADAHDDYVTISIADSGPGVAPEIRHRIFEPFFTTKDVGKGTGLGLAVCRQIIVENHGGQLDLDASHAPGARFVIRLPLGARWESRGTS